MSNKTYFVTGGAGFIGSEVVRQLIENCNNEVINIDKLTYAGDLESVKKVENSPRYVFEKVDICNAGELRRILSKYRPDAIIHLAAESHVDRSIDGPSEFINTNIVGTYTLLEMTREYWAGLDKEKRESFRFLHVSTDEVYGDLIHPDDCEEPELPKFKEQTPYKPSSPYSASKASSDHLVRAWNKTFGLPTIITNCSNNYGPYQYPEKLIPVIIFNALEGKKIPIYGKGNQIRDWLYVEDHVRALIEILNNGGIGETYNIGGYNEKKNIEVVEAICEILDGLRPKKGKYLDQITFVSDRPGHDKRYAIDADKLRGELNWTPKETFDSGLMKTVLWYLNNVEWCKRIKEKN